MRRGLSLVEILVAIAMLSIASVSLMHTFSVTRELHVRQDAVVTAQLLARSVLAQVQGRFDVDDSRFYTLGSTPAQIKDAIARGDWAAPFRALARPRGPLGATGDPYFDPVFGPRLPLETDPGTEHRFFAQFTYEVLVDFERSEEASGPRAALDADGDGRPEIDLARAVVNVYFEPLDGKRSGEPLASLSMLLVLPDKDPAVTVVAGP